jgi:hypothetical protein
MGMWKTMSDFSTNRRARATVHACIDRLLNPTILRGHVLRTRIGAYMGVDAQVKLENYLPFGLVEPIKFGPFCRAMTPKSW